MELLGNLEEKIKRLVELVKKTQEQKDRLEVENVALLEKVNQLEQSLSKQEKGSEDWNQERASAKKAVDELISDIDSLIESGSR